MPELNVSRKTISKLFTDMQNKKFIVPEYQRPYKWDVEKCETLWNDIINFHQNRSDNDEYFLGTFVSFKNQDNNIEIIDGQQRITSLFLLLRAFYRKLENMSEEDINVKGLKSQISPCIWDIDPISQVVNDRTRIHIQSLVATDEDKKVFHNILETGNPLDSKDLYSKNYKFFFDSCEEFARQNPMSWQPLCVNILHKCIVLPIECDVQDTALTIFSTLNDRGMPLSDSDIFKAQIYKNTASEEEKKAFTQEWKELTSVCEFANISLEDLFRFNSHVIRAKKGDKSKEIGLRKFYAQDQYEKLKDPNLMQSLKDLSDFWLYVNTNKLNDGLNYEFSIETKKLFHCLALYPNEFWKYATSVFFLKNKEDSELDLKLQNFLKKLMSFLFVKFIANPSANAIKDDIYQLCVDIEKNNAYKIQNPLNEDELKNKINDFSTSKLSRSLILLHAYLNPSQQELINKTFDVEHIFPKKWQNTNYNGWDEASAKAHLENFGNKVAIEKKLNIQAGNNYFGNKKAKYLNSNVSNVKDLANLKQSDWSKEDIEARNNLFISNIVEYFKSALN